MYLNSGHVSIDDSKGAMNNGNHSQRDNNARDIDDITLSKTATNNWKEAFVASSSSQRRYLLPAADNDFLRASRSRDGSQKSDGGAAEKLNFPQSLFNWTVNDSLAETKVNMANLKADLDKLCRDEDVKRKDHNHSRGNLQEAWDKLVQLRTHISLFKSAIEEATIEDVSLQATRGSWSSNHLSFSNRDNLLTAESAMRLGDAHGIREKVRLKEGLQRKVLLVEEFLTDLRAKLAHNSNELTKVNNSTERLFVADTISASMDIRQAVISISKQLEDAERY
jgi:hypothetical protein